MRQILCHDRESSLRSRKGGFGDAINTGRTMKRGIILEHQRESHRIGNKRFQAQKDKIRIRLLRYTRKAFQMLPHIDHPRILDVGCGSGIPTLELARLSQGEVIGIDIDQPALDKFTKKIEEMGFTDRVQAMNLSMLSMDFADESFDIIWSEGSIYAIGFEKGLREWKRFLKPGGFIVIHDEQGNVSKKLKLIYSYGYELLGTFMLSKEIWWTEYFSPLEKLVKKFLREYADNAEILEELKPAQEELDMFRKNPARNSSVYFVMKKKN